MNWKLEAAASPRIYRAKSYQAIEELIRICCAEAERARQLGIGELSAQEEEGKSTVNQLMVQIQELQDKVNALSDAKEFYVPETASSSGLSRRSQSAYEYSESSWNDSPRFLLAARHTELTWHVRKRV